MGGQGSIIIIVTHNGLEYPRIISWCFCDVQTNPKVHPDCFTMGTGSLLGGKAAKVRCWPPTYFWCQVANGLQPYLHLRFVPALACWSDIYLQFSVFEVIFPFLDFFIVFGEDASLLLFFSLMKCVLENCTLGVSCVVAWVCC